MSQKKYDVVGIGNALVDVLSHAEDEFLIKHDIPRGTMTLIDEGRAEALYDVMGPGTEMSGGSGANTIAGVASLGGRAGFVGRVKDDQLGGVFIHDLKSAGIDFGGKQADSGTATGRCLIFVTPDAQRSMNTFLGAGQDLTPEDVNMSLIQDASIVYLEGYLWDPPGAKEAFREVMGVCQQAGSKVSMTLSDPFCVDRYREEFLGLIKDGKIDILFANEVEIISLFEAQDFDSALQSIRGLCETVALTRSEKGCVVLSGEETHIVDAASVDRVVDTTGAGDLFASGFLYGLAKGHAPAVCARLGAESAAEVISHFGARPETPLDKLIAGRGIL